MKKSISNNLMFTMLKTVSSLLFPLITFPYASRVLGVNNIGHVQYYNSIVSYFVLIAQLGTVLYSVREGSKYKDDKIKLSQFFKEIIIINFISTVISYLLFYIFVIFLMKNTDMILISICSITIMFTSFQIEWLYQIVEDFKYISIRAFLMQLCSLIFLLLFVKSKNDYYIYAIILVASTTGNCFFNLFNARKYIDFSVKNELNIKKHIKPIMIIFGTSLATSIYLNLDTVMLGALKGSFAVGLYTASVKVVQAVKSLINSISNVLFPRLSNYLGTKKIKEYKILFYNGLRGIIVVILPSAIGLCMLSKEIIYLFSGIEYIQAWKSSMILAINIIFSVIDGALYYQVLLPFGQEINATKCTILGAVSNLILNFIFIPFFSYNGAALTTLISEFIVFLGLMHFSNKSISTVNIIRYLVKYSLLCLPIILICIVIKLFFNSAILIIVVSFIISAIVYFLELIALKDKMVFIVLNKLNREL